MKKKDNISFKTYSAKPNEIERKWVLIDADGQTLGRLCTKIATVLRGKDKPEFTPHVDTGDFVIVINASKVKLTGAKADKKEYFHNTLYPGGGRYEKFADVFAKRPERVIEDAVWGMLPKNNLGRKLYTKLKVYPNADHPHASQTPETVAV